MFLLMGASCFGYEGSLPRTCALAIHEGRRENPLNVAFVSLLRRRALARVQQPKGWCAQST